MIGVRSSVPYWTPHRLARARRILSSRVAALRHDIARELRDVESALTRIRAGSYGDCVDCGQPIDPMRLEFNPHVARCLRCQERAERTPGHEGRASSSL